MTAEQVGEKILYADPDGAGVSLRDALMAIYAAYYIGSARHEAKDHLNTVFNLRAPNRFNMMDAMQAAFGHAQSPWVVLDHLSDHRRDGDTQNKELFGAHFITLYHRASGRVMIAMPGLESDDGIKDTLHDITQLSVGGMLGQSAALHLYAAEVTQKMAAGAYKDSAGQPLRTTGEKPLIGAHSMGCTAAQMMALDGYETVLLEPRPVHNGLLRRITANLSAVTGQPRMARAEAVACLDARSVNIRSRHANVWNSLILPWVRAMHLGDNYAYSVAGHVVKPVDRTIGNQHRAEMSVPSLNGHREASGFQAGAYLIPQAAQDRRMLLADIVHKPKPR